MTRNTGVGPSELPEETFDDPDLALLTDYLAKELPPEQVAEVERRLREDEAFRKFAAPLFVAWSVPPRWQRQPMSRETLAKHWDEFTKRAGFVHQREKARKRRRRWIFGISSIILLPVVALLLFMVVSIGQGMWALYSGAAPTLADAQWSSTPVDPATADSAGWISIGKVRAKLDTGAILVRAESPRLASLVRLDHGSARFLYMPKPAERVLADTALFGVLTRAGFVVSPGADLHVRTRADTTDVEVLRRVGGPAREPGEADFAVITNGPGGPGRTVFLREGEIGRIEGRSPPIKLRSVRFADPIENNPALRKVFGDLMQH